MKKSSSIILLLLSSSVLADATGIYLGGGIGYGMQNLVALGTTTQGTPALRGFAGYQFASWMDVELGYTYIAQGPNWNNLGTPSTTVYDLAFTPGFSIPLTPVTVYSRLGINSVSANLNSSWYNQVFSNQTANFEWGAGVKVDIPGTRTFVRAEYLNFGSAVNNDNSNLTVQASVAMITAGYVF